MRQRVSWRMPAATSEAPMPARAADHAGPPPCAVATTRILGIDPGSQRTGIGIIDASADGRSRPVFHTALHLLGNDNGCIWRHRYEPEEKHVHPFRSGWLNVDCREYA